MKGQKLLLLSLTTLLLCGCSYEETKRETNTTTANLQTTPQVTTATTTTAVTTIGLPSGTTVKTMMTTTTPLTTTTQKPTTTTTTTKQTTTTTKKVTTTTVTTKKVTTTTKKIVIPDLPKENEFFNDAIFIGDSVSYKLKLFTMSEASKGNYPLGTATFFTAGSFSWSNSLWDVNNKNSVHPMLNGKKMGIADAIKESKAKKAYIMLGMNDIASYGNDKAIENVIKVLNQIDEKDPDVTIYIQSVTPIIKGKEHGRFTNENIHKFNNKMKEICDERGYVFLDLNTVMGGDYLIKDYCGDPEAMGIHFTNAACKVWIDYLIKNE